MARRRRRIVLQIDDINPDSKIIATLLVVVATIAIFLTVNYLILPKNFSKRLDVRESIRATRGQNNYNFEVKLYVDEGKTEGFLVGKVSGDRIDLEASKRVNDSQLVDSKIRIDNNSLIESSASSFFDQQYFDFIRFGIGGNVKSDPETIKQNKELFLGSIYGFLDPVSYLELAKKGKVIGKTNLEEKICTWYLVSDFDGKSINDFKNMIKSFDSKTSVQVENMEILVDDQSKILRRTKINYKMKDKNFISKVDFSDYK